MTLLPELIGDSAGLVAVRTQVERLLRRHSDGGRVASVLILGETGTGKNLLARNLHASGPRSRGPFVMVDCSTLSPTLLESELFGHERGAFTDAREAKMGLVQAAHRGTVFFNEIAELPENLQAKLLTVLDERTVRRVGSTRSEVVDVSIIAATSEDLKPGRRGFRDDLFFRLSVVTLRLPPLRERGGDILTLAEHYLRRSAERYKQLPKTLGDDTRAALLAYRWPGNVRELAHMMERIVLSSDASIVTVDRLGLSVARQSRTPGPGATASDRSPATEPRAGQVRDETERAPIIEALRITGGNISRAAEQLGVTRNTLRYRMAKLGFPAHVRAAVPVDAVTATSATPAVRLTWERRHVALLRADLFAMSGDPFDATSMLRRFLEKVDGFGGRVEDVSPTGLVAIFGLEPVEDAARRAAHAALSIQTLAMQDHGTEPVPSVRIGLHAGDVLVAWIDGVGRVDADTKREAWATLGPCMADVGPGTILVSQAARMLLERRFALTPVTLDRGDRGCTYRLDGIRGGGAGLGEHLTPLVARSDELRQLEDALEHAGEGHGQVVGVTGEAGVGKSRLLWELGQSLRSRNCRVLVAGAASYGPQAPYLPVIDLLKTYFLIEARDDVGQISKRVISRLLALGPPLVAAAPALLALLDVPVVDAPWSALDPYQKHRRTLEALTRLLVEESRLQPVVVVIEDLHWIDSKTQEVLDALVESIPQHRLLILASYRPEYRHGWGNKSYYTQILLEPLSPDVARLLLDHLLGREAATPELTSLLITRTGGNPFFLEESIRSLVETGILVGDRGAYCPAGDMKDIEVPASVHAMLAARIERLAPNDRTLLQTAAVIGSDVPFALLQAVAGLAEAPLRAGLVRLRATEFLAAMRLMPELGYAFKHALSHEVAYAGLLPEPRRLLHARIVQAIEALHADRIIEHVDRLAHHALRGEVWERAVTYLSQAGAKAAARSAYRESVTCLEHALDALTHLPASRETNELGIDLRLALRNALHPLGEIQRALERLGEGRSLAERIGDQRRLGWVSVCMAHQFWLGSDLDRAVEYGQRALALAQAEGDVPLAVVANLRLDGGPKLAPAARTSGPVRIPLTALERRTPIRLVKA